MANYFGQSIPVTGLLLGFPGKISRLGDPLTASRQVLASTANPISFGAPVVIVPNASNGGDTVQSVADYIAGVVANGGLFLASQFAGVAVAEVVTTAGFPYGPDSPVTANYLQGAMADILERGTIDVYIANGTPKSQQPVYLRLALNGSVPNGVVGDIEAANDTTVTTGITTTLNSTAATVTSGTGIAVGQLISGNANIPAGTLVAAISGTSLTLSKAATAAGSAVSSNFNGTVALPNVMFRTGAMDANNISEITLLSREAA